MLSVKKDKSEDCKQQRSDNNTVSNKWIFDDCPTLCYTSVYSTDLHGWKRYAASALTLISQWVVLFAAQKYYSTMSVVSAVDAALCLLNSSSSVL